MQRRAPNGSVARKRFGRRTRVGGPLGTWSGQLVRRLSLTRSGGGDDARAADGGGVRGRAGEQRGTRRSNSELAHGGSRRDGDSTTEPVRHGRIVGRVGHRGGRVERRRVWTGSARVRILAGSAQCGS